MKIKEIGTVITGKTPSTSNSSFFEGDIPFITPSDIAKGFIVEESLRHIGNDGFESIINNTLSETSVLVGCIGSDMGNVAITTQKCATNQQINAITNFRNDVNPFFVYYYLSLFKSYFQQISNSTTTPLLPKSDFEKINIDLPSYKIQCNIADLLSSIDHKISLNRRINSTLEAMAKQLYDYWFVQFDFPNEEGKPYKSSGGKMVWNEKLKREIPEGWEVKSVNELCTSYRGVSYDKSDLLSDNNGILVLRGNNIQNSALVYDNNVAYIPQHLVSEEQKIKRNDIVMTMSSGSKEHIGKCMLFKYDSKDTYGAFLTKFTNMDIPNIMFLFFISDYCKAKIKVICNGTGINNLTNQTFDEILLALPTNELCNKFENIVEPYLSKRGANEQENLHLTSLRDFLLPLLMNGQVTINDK